MSHRIVARWAVLLGIGGPLGLATATDPPLPEVRMAGTGTTDVDRAARQEPRMQTRTSGTGPRVALIGGGLTGWLSWEPHAERLASARSVALLQLLSVQYGLEDRPLPDGYGVRLERRALAGALDALGWHDPVDLVAWSYGALVTLDFALNHARRVRTLTLIEPPAVWVLPDHGAGDPDVATLRQLAVEIGSDVSEADLERFVCTVALCPPGVPPQQLPQWPVWVEHRRSLRSGASPFEHRDDTGRLDRFDRPVLLVRGTGTSPFLGRVIDVLGERFAHARTIELPAGHAPQLVSMDAFLDEVRRFLEGADGPQG